MTTHESVRVRDFDMFSSIVIEHINNYTIPQYGDSPGDEVERWTAEQCIIAIQKYTKRYLSSRRGRLETLRDMVKIAHFAQLAFDKMIPSLEEEEKIREGTV